MLNRALEILAVLAPWAFVGMLVLVAALSVIRIFLVKRLRRKFKDLKDTVPSDELMGKFHKAAKAGKGLKLTPEEAGELRVFLDALLAITRIDWVLAILGLGSIFDDDALETMQEWVRDHKAGQS